MKRLTWFAGGVAAGVAGAGYAKRKVRTTLKRRVDDLRDRSTVARAAATTAGTARRTTELATTAFRNGRAAFVARPRSLRIRRGMSTESIDSRLGPNDQLFVDGQPVDPARVTVLSPRAEPGRTS